MHGHFVHQMAHMILLYQASPLQRKNIKMLRQVVLSTVIKCVLHSEKSSF